MTGVDANPAALPAERLRWRCDPARYSFETTADIEAARTVVGQEAAVEALQFGLETMAHGQNIFVRGLTGTGRMTLIQQLLEEIQPACPLADDRCYVHNFDDPTRPRLLTLARGQGPIFREAVDHLADFIRDELGRALETDEVKQRLGSVQSAFQAHVRQVGEPFEKRLAQAGLALLTAQVGPTMRTRILPLVENSPVPWEKLEELKTQKAMDDKRISELKEQAEGFGRELEEITDTIRALKEQHEEEVAKVIKEEAAAVLQPMTSRIKQQFDREDIAAFVDHIVADVLESRLGVEQEKDFTRLYRVNVILTHGPDESCPVVIEELPSMSNLVGTIAFEPIDEETAVADHLSISAGSLLRADGGYLILDARDVLTEPGAWRSLVRTLRWRRLQIVNTESPFFKPMLLPKPEPIPVQIKVVLVGDAGLYYLLDEHDSDFGHLFKVLADFDSVVPNNGEALEHYASVIARIAEEDHLPPFHREAVALLVEHGARVASSQRELSARFSRLADIAREAAFLAGKSGDVVVQAEHVRETIRRTRRRADLSYRRFRRFIANGTIRIETRGSVLAQMNGLAVAHAGPIVYGFPSRITASIGAGSGGMINIEREASLSGSIHTKGFYILSGLLRNLLHADHPLAFEASIAFEQSYGGIDGDSASGAETCCLLSALTDIPLRQDLAMTGAVDQHGNILPIGAVNEKIEGFFDVCADAGLTGTQGVIIPQANVADLMLREDVVDACADGQFHVHAVERIEQAISLLTGRSAGTRSPAGTYEDDSVLGTAVSRAGDYWQHVRRSTAHASPPKPAASEDHTQGA